MDDSPTAPANNMPMFYTSPRPLDRATDANLKVSRPSHFLFAAHTNAIPLLIDEFPLAAAHYPIVFADGPTPIPAAVVGLQNDKNLFVDPQGRWVKNAYLPAYVRRYPFILMDDTAQKQFVLCIDEASDMVGAQGEYPLFEGDQPSGFTKNAMDFCSALRQQGDVTDAFVKELKSRDLLMANDAKLDIRDGSQLQLSGFLVINPQKFDALPDATFLEWRKKGWLGLVYAQLLSSHRWQSLIDLMQNRK